MFQCGVCKSFFVPGEPAARIVLERRAKVYDLGGATTEGWEVVREILAHAGCALSAEDKARAEAEAAEKAAAGGATLAEVPGMTDLMIEPEAIEEYEDFGSAVDEESEKPRRRKRV